LSFGVLKQVHAKYGWFCEAVNFAAEATKLMIGDGEYKQNEKFGKTFFEAAMKEYEFGEYDLVSFKGVDEGDLVFGKTAPTPGYAAEIRVPIAVLDVPLIGKQEVEIPMRYYSLGEMRRGEKMH